MRIAICFSGQIRTWRNCYESWFSLIEEMKTNPKFIDENIEVDFFMHMWDFNTIPPHEWPIIDGVRTEMRDVYDEVPKEEIGDIISIMQPKKILIEGYSKSASREKFVRLRSLSLGNANGGVISWAASQLYSIMRAGQLKTDYENENNFTYDMCVKMRYDGKISELSRSILISEIHYPIQPQTIFSMHSNNTNEFPYEYIGDIFFYSDSQTYNILSSFYFWTPYFTNDVLNSGIRIEAVFSYFARLFNINNRRSSLDIEMVRKK